MNFHYNITRLDNPTFALWATVGRSELNNLWHPMVAGKDKDSVNT